MSIDLSLLRVQRLFSMLPVYTRPTIHIAGTNGKGSVTAILSSIFTASRVSVGRFNSPHLINVWDSISIDGRSVSEDTYHAVRKNVETINREESIEASSFEIMTATAAQIFEQARVDIAIFEVGLGGRLDATNVLPNDSILVSAITSVDLDHQFFLGNTPAAIAREKAGIARPTKACVLGAQMHPEVEPVVQEVVHSVGGYIVNAMDVTPRSQDASLSSSQVHFQTVAAPFSPWDTTLELKLPLPGAHQRQNLAIALTILSVLISGRSRSPIEAILDRITPSTLHAGVLSTKWPGRLEYVRLLDPPLTFLVDGAHNPASAAALQSYLMSITPPHAQEPHSSERPRTFILGLSHSPPKTPLDTLTPLLRPGDRVALVSFTDVEGMPWVKNVPLTELGDVVRQLVNGGEVKLFEFETGQDKLSPLKRALAWAGHVSSGEMVILAGSLYLVADLYRIASEQKAL